MNITKITVEALIREDATLVTPATAIQFIREKIKHNFVLKSNPVSESSHFLQTTL
jgi:hypothetical protein